MPGFLGGSTSGGGTGGEITFPKEFIDPVTKFRVSQPETLIDTDFEYGLQPTKWETVELINNTPSFFSKSGDTTIPNIVSVTTNAGTREITVTTGLDHGLAVGIPINVQGTKSITADGAYIINSIPNTRTFTYLSKDVQPDTLSIEDLYTSIITGEFFQGSQLRIADSEGIITDGGAISTLTVKTESNHGFGVNTPFYFLNLNSTVAQEFEAANTAAKSFDSSNSAAAQSFDGSNTASQISIDFSNSGVVGGTPSSIVGTDASANTITVTHTTESFVGSFLGTPLYYDVTTSAGYFANNPRGVVFLKTTNQLASGTSVFQVSEVPDGDAINIEASITGTFQLANQARTFAGNNVNPDTQIDVTVVKEDPIAFEGANDQSVGANGSCTVTSYSGSLVNVSIGQEDILDYYTGAMVFYSTDGSAASGLTNNTTYFIDSFFSTGPSTYAFTLKPLPTSAAISNISGGTGTQSFDRIGVSLDKDIIHIKDSSFTKGQMIRYDYPESGSVASNSLKSYFFVDTVYDTHNYKLRDDLFSPIEATGGTVTTQEIGGITYKLHTFTSDGTFNVTSVSNDFNEVELFMVGGGGGTGSYSGGAGGGEVVQIPSLALSATPQSYTIDVGNGGQGNTSNVWSEPRNGRQTTALGQYAKGGGGGKGSNDGTPGNNSTYNAVANGGGGSSRSAGYRGSVGAFNNGATGTRWGGQRGGQTQSGNGSTNNGNNYPSGGGGGAGQSINTNSGNYRATNGGNGIQNNILGTNYYWAGGGGGQTYYNNGFTYGGNGGLGGGGGGGTGDRNGTGGGSALNSGGNASSTGGSGGANTGGGGGGGRGETGSRGGFGGSGIVVIKYPITQA